MEENLQSEALDFSRGSYEYHYAKILCLSNYTKGVVYINFVQNSHSKESKSLVERVQNRLNQLLETQFSFFVFGQILLLSSSNLREVFVRQS